MRFVGVEKAVARFVGLVLRPGYGDVRCSQCERPLPADAFHKDNRRPDGHRAACVDCDAITRERRYRRLKLAGKVPVNASPIEKKRAAAGRRARNYIVRSALKRGQEAILRLAAGLSVDGRRSWTRPDRRAERVG